MRILATWLLTVGRARESARPGLRVRHPLGDQRRDLDLAFAEEGGNSPHLLGILFGVLFGVGGLCFTIGDVLLGIAGARSRKVPVWAGVLIAASILVNIVGWATANDLLIAVSCVPLAAGFLSVARAAGADELPRTESEVRTDGRKVRASAARTTG